MSYSLGTLVKQPSEVLDANFDFSDWLTDKADTIGSVSVVADEGIEVEEVTDLEGVVKVFFSGGTDGSSYKVTVTVTTTREPLPRIKEAEIYVAVREV